MTSTPVSTKPADRLERLLRFVATDSANERLRADVFETALAAGAFDEAQRQVVWALTRDPADFAWRHRLALLDMARGEWDEARALLEGLEAEGQAGPAIAYNLAYIEFAQGRRVQAELRMRQLAESDFDAVPQSLTVLMACQHGRGAPQEAVQTFRTFASRVEAAATFGAASLAAVDAHERDAAQAWAAQALLRDPLQADALVAQATMLIIDKAPRAALELLGRYLEQRPNDGRALSAAGLSQLLCGDVARAREMFARSAAAAPEHVETWLAQGWCDFLLDDMAAARASFERALSLRRDRADIHAALAAVDASQGRRADAEAAVRRAGELDPSGTAAQPALAILAGKAEAPERVLMRLQAAMGQGSRFLARPLDVPRNDGL